MAKSAPFRRSLKEELRDPEFAQEYEAELQRLRIAEQIARARQAAGLTQAGLAQRMGTSQPAVARLEDGKYGGYTVTTLTKAASALSHRLKIELTPTRSPAVAFCSFAGRHTKKAVSRRAAKKKR